MNFGRIRSLLSSLYQRLVAVPDPIIHRFFCQLYLGNLERRFHQTAPSALRIELTLTPLFVTFRTSFSDVRILSFLFFSQLHTY